MNFLFVSHIWPPATDGGSKILSKIENYFSKKNNNTLVITTNCSLSDDFVKSKYFKSPSSKNILRLPIIKTHRHLPKPIFKIIPFFTTLKSISKFNPSYIFAGPFPTAISLYSLLFKYILKSKLILLPCFHQTDTDFNQFYIKICLKKADLILALTQSEKNFFHNNFKINPHKILVIGGGVDKEFLKTSKSTEYKKYITFIGNFASHKNVELLISAFEKLSPIYPDLKLFLLGQKTLYFPKINQTIKKLTPKIRSKIKFIFNPTQFQIKQTLDNSICLVNPSNQESFGLVFVEALARSIPIIGTDIPPVKELIAKTQGGLIFKQNNLDSLIEQILYLINNPKKAQMFVKNGFDYIKNNLTWDKIGERIEKFL